MAHEIGGDALLRVFTTERARSDGKPLYEHVVLAARERGLKGATVLRGAMGYGHSAHIQTANILDLSSDLPVIVEIIDSEDALRGLLAEISTDFELAMVTLSPLEIVHRGAGA